MTRYCTAASVTVAALFAAACNSTTGPGPGPRGDGGTVLAGADGGTTDGALGPVDMVGPPQQADLGPLPQGLSFYAAPAGLGVEVVDAAPDEAGNVWAVSEDALYIKRAGDDFFRRYGTSDGLYVYKTITAVAGAGANEGYVGLLGAEDGDPLNDPMTLKQAGKLDHVRLMPDGSILATHLGDIHNYPYAQDYWETRSARRLLYVRSGPNAGHLFMGGNHGVTNILTSNDSYGDHVHVEATWPDGSLVTGDWYGLAIDPKTNGLWHCGAASCGLLNYYSNMADWVGGTYPYAFTVFLPGHDLAIPKGYREDHVAVAVTPDDTVYFLSASDGVASWDPATQDYETIARRAVPGLGGGVDMVADSDGTLWVADAHRVLHWDPRTGAATPLALPSDDIRRLSIDTSAKPRALYVSTGIGLAVYAIP